MPHKYFGSVVSKIGKIVRRRSPVTIKPQVPTNRGVVEDIERLQGRYGRTKPINQWGEGYYGRGSYLKGEK